MIKKTSIVAVLSAFVCAIVSMAQSSNIAYKDGNVRFTVITDGVIRMEYAPAAQWC